MAVDVKTLRIGSHVLAGGKRIRICGITKRKVGYHLMGKPCERLTYVRDCEVEPIPITPDLLAELGFQYRDNTYWERWFLGGFDIERKEGSSYFDYNSEIRLEYLHELEDLYYLIYGVELINETKNN